MSLVEAEILTRVIAPENPSLGRQLAEAIIRMRFAASDKRRMDRLAEKARQGSLSATEHAEAESYERVGHFVSLLKSKARRSLASNEP